MKSLTTSSRAEIGRERRYTPVLLRSHLFRNRGTARRSVKYGGRPISHFHHDFVRAVDQPPLEAACNHRQLAVKLGAAATPRVRARSGTLP